MLEKKRRHIREYGEYFFKHWETKDYVLWSPDLLTVGSNFRLDK